MSRHDTSATSEPSLGDLVGDLGSDLSQLMRKEVELAKVEARAELRRMSRAATFAGIAGLAALVASVILSIALAWWLDQGLSTAVAFAIVGAIWLLLATVAVTVVRSEISQLRPLPETTDAIKGAVTGERADDGPARTAADALRLSPTHQISDTRRSDKETAS